MARGHELDNYFEMEKLLDEQDLEQEIQSKGLNAPRPTPEGITACIVDEQYHVFPGTLHTVCCLTLRNGFTVIGESACASLENFDAALGRKIARDDAKSKTWQLEGYLLKQRLYIRGGVRGE